MSQGTSLQNRLILWLAEGFGVGRIPVAPGTFGSILGIGWLVILMLARQWWIFSLGTLAGLAASVWLCDRAEKILRQKDPGSVIVDEIAAIPLCSVSWLALTYGGVPGPGECFASNWPWLAVIFVLFRIFDVAKPWPVYQSQSLPGGWGVTIDDALAAIYVNLVMAIIWAFRLVW